MADKDYSVPIFVRNRILRGTLYSRVERDEIFQKFVEGFSNINDDESNDFNKIVLNFDRNFPRKSCKQKFTTTSKKLSFRKRKELGLYTIGKKSLKYKDLLPLHKLWEDYMRKYLNLDKQDINRLFNQNNDSNIEQISLKLYRADFHGSKMTVIKSKCPSFVGKSGIVAMETKNCFKLLESDNIIRTVPKASCMFEFKLDDLKFRFLGQNLQVRPADRSSKKIKTVHMSDLQL